MMSDDATRAQIMAHEQARRQAMIDADLAALDRLVDDGLVYQHGTGARQGKADYIGLIAAGGYRYTAIGSSNEELYLYPGVAVIVTTLHFHCVGEAGPFEAHRRATLIWARRGEGWRLEVYQGTIMPTEDTREREFAHEPASVKAQMAAETRA